MAEQCYLLGIDIGTTGGKVGLFDTAGNLVALYNRDYPTISPGGGVAEQRSEDWWEVAKAGAGRVLCDAGVAAGQVKAVGLTSMTPALLPLDKQRRPLRNAIIWMDQRGGRYVEEVRRLCGPEILSVSGNNIIGGLLGVMLYRFMREERALYEETDRFVLATGYIGYKLTGELSFDRADLELSLLGGMPDHKFSPDVLAKLGLDIARFPAILEATDLVGEVSGAAALETGLAQGTPVFAGLHDSAATAYAMGITQVGYGTYDLGNAANFGICVDTLHAHAERAGMVYSCAQKGMYIRQDYVSTAGSALRWAKEVLFEADEAYARAEGKNVYDVLSGHASQSPPGSSGVLFVPHLSGQHHCGATRAAFIGMSLATAKSDMVRAVLEGIAFSAREMKGTLEAATRGKLEKLFMAGGGSASDLWCQIHADVLGIPVRVPDVNHTAVMGAALIAGVAAGFFPLREAPFCKIKKTYEPRRENIAIYQDMYERYLMLSAVGSMDRDLIKEKLK